MAKFKVGDKVRITNTKHDCKKYLVGREFVIKEVFRTCNNDLGCYSIGEPYLVNAPELELVKPKFDIKDYHGKVVMHCSTKKEAEIFCGYLHSLGRTWNSGHSYEGNTKYHNHGARTCYEFLINKYDVLEYFIPRNYRILKFNDFDWSDFTMKKEFTKADLKNGDVVKRRDGSVEILISDLNLFVGDHGDFAEVYGINEDLTSNVSPTRDIVAVRRMGSTYGNPFQAFKNKYGNLVYERKEVEVEEMTLEEVCKALGKEIKIVKK